MSSLHADFLQPVTADIKRLIEILTTSLHSDPFTPIREYIANAHDATVGNPAPEISISVEGGSRLVIRDNGCGMTRKVILEAFTRIASHHSQFDERSVGQFGLGVLSAFMVADRLVVETRSAQEATGWRLEWKSREAEFTILPIDREDLGTTAILCLTDEAIDLADNGVLRDYVSKTFALFPVPISIGANQPAVNEHWRWLASQREMSRNPRLVFDAEAVALLRRFLHLDISAVYISHEPDGSRIFLGIPAAEHSPLDLHKVAFFSKGILVHGNMRGFFPPNLAFVGGLVDSPKFALQIDREGFVRDKAFRALKDSMEQHILSSLHLLAKEHPAAIERVLHTHRTMLVAQAESTPRLRSLLSDHYRFETSAGVSHWADILPFAVADPQGGSRKVVYALSSADRFQAVLSTARTQGLVAVFASGAERVLLEKIAREDNVRIEDAAKLHDPNGLTVIPQPFQRLGARLGAALMSRGIGSINFINLLDEKQHPAMFRLKSSGGFLPGGSPNIEDLVSVDGLTLNIAHPLIQGLAGRVQDLDAETIQKAADIIYFVAVLQLPYSEVLAAVTDHIIGSLIDSLRRQVEGRKYRERPAAGLAKCFVALPYREPFDNVWRGLEQVLGAQPYFWEVIRADEDLAGDSLLFNVQDLVDASQRYVADISGLNPNVLIELGLMLQQDRNSVLILCDEETYNQGFPHDESSPRKGIPTDLKGKVLLVYPSEVRGSIDEMAGWLRERIPAFTQFSALQGTRRTTATAEGSAPSLGQPQHR